MALGSELPRLDGYPFEVRYSEGSLARAQASAEVAADAFGYFNSLFSDVEPDISVVIADEPDWPDDGPSYGMPFFSDERGDRPGVLVMPARTGAFWDSIASELCDQPGGYDALRATYPDGSDGFDLQPFIDLITLHELAHAYEVLGDLRLPTNWLGEIFANLALHTFVAIRRPASLQSLETFSTIGVGNEPLATRLRAEGYATLDEFEAHYPGSDEPIGWLNFVWFQARWQRLVAAMFDAEGEDALVRLWRCFHATDRLDASDVTASSLASLLTSDVSPTLGRAIRDWR